MRSHLFNSEYARFSSQPGLIEVGVLSTLKRSFALPKENCVVAGVDASRKGGLSFMTCGQLVEVQPARKATDEELAAWPNPTVSSRTTGEDSPLLLHTIYMQPEKDLYSKNTLDDLSYSLLVVENYAKPFVHFQQAHRTLPVSDFETIKNGWVYYARTAFGKLANALPLENRLELRIRIAQDLQVEDTGHKDYVLLLRFLFDYIEDRILSRGRHLVAANQKFHRIFQGSLIPQRIGFEDPSSKNGIDYVDEQARLFEVLLDKAKPEIFQRLSLNSNEDSELNSRFVDLFGRRPLPLNLID